jgi:hypothetical protein
MEKATLQIGVKDFSIEVEFSQPTTLSDVHVAARKDEEYIVSKFVRGYRIDLQEKSGAREYVREMLKGKSAAAAMKDEAFKKVVKAGIEKLLKEFDPSAERKRGPRGPQEVKVTADEMKAAGNDPQKLMALMISKGVKIQLVSE